jgi:hypothetical protein
MNIFCKNVNTKDCAFVISFCLTKAGFQNLFIFCENKALKKFRAQRKEEHDAKRS